MTRQRPPAVTPRSNPGVQTPRRARTSSAHRVTPRGGHVDTMAMGPAENAEAPCSTRASKATRGARSTSARAMTSTSRPSRPHPGGGQPGRVPLPLTPADDYAAGATSARGAAGEGGLRRQGRSVRVARRVLGAAPRARATRRGR